MTHSYAVDVSANQPSHQPWKSWGVHMGIAKATEGQHSKDLWFVRHMDDITAAGIPVRGAYHFAWPNQSAALEAANYVAAVTPLARARSMYHILDLEPYAESPGVPPRNYVGAGDARIRQYARDWVAAVKRAFPGAPVLCYTPRDNVARHYPDNADGYWYPAYPVQGRSFAQATVLPRPMYGPGGSAVWGWQFTSVDRDKTVIYMTPAELIASVHGAAAPAKEEDVALTTEDKEFLKALIASPDTIQNAVWTRKWNSPTTGKPTMMGTYLAWNDKQTAMVIQAVQDASNASAATVVKALTPLIGTDADTDQVIAALKAALLDSPVLKIEVTNAPAVADSSNGE